MVDFWGVWCVVDVCVEVGIDCFVMISFIGVGDLFLGLEVLCLYLVVKCCVDDYFEQLLFDVMIFCFMRFIDVEGIGFVLLIVESFDGDMFEILWVDVVQVVVVSFDIDWMVGEMLMFMGGDMIIEWVFCGDD